LSANTIQSADGAYTYGLDVFEGMQLGTETTVDAEELFVHNCRQRQRTEGFQACFVEPFTIFVLALQLEGEVVGQMATFVITPQQPK
jgi:hypothetical protein